MQYGTKLQLLDNPHLKTPPVAGETRKSIMMFRVFVLDDV